ncbi:hypothetical protein M8998_15185 [Sphingobacterium sp. lm-10]|uniref:DUF6965 family protein n=1 Tax=Sphingobacterium sp. lm-10 TaxID=2944904 RepID=UPI0020226764|nr:hypothetical protein [Sphingobacterium sp. lm-10]MCL7989293.1 hypothetical protein [Sphingobacterium sp. lm-10]
MELTPEQLKEALLGKKHPNNIRINPAAVVIDADQFLAIQFDMVARHKGDLQRSAAWQRLREFYIATNENS